MMKLGKHVSIAGGIEKAPDRARKIGCNCLQIFIKNPRGWQGRKISDSNAALIRKKLYKQEMNPLLVHNTYLINPASPKNDLWQKSNRGLAEEYLNAGKIGAGYYVIHPGNHTGSGKTKGIKRIIKSLNILLSKVKNDTMILLENVAGSGTAIGSNFSELYDIIKNVDERSRVGVCFDSCHAFTAGYNLSSNKDIDNMLKEFDEVIGLELLKVIHINDSKYDFATKKDEHAHIGQGKIGIEGISYFINHPQLKDLPFILETPHFKDREKDKDVEILFSLREDG